MTSKISNKPHWAIIHPFQLRLQRGIETYVWGLSAALARSGVEVDIITWDGPLTVPEDVKAAGVQIFAMPNFRYFEGFFASIYYVSKLLKNRYDHVFNHFAGYGEGAALNLIRKWKEQHYSVVFHFPPSLVPHRYVEFRNWHINRDADYLIGVSEGTAREVSNWSGRQVDVIGHGANASYFSPDPELRKKTRRQLGIPDDALVLITVAALEERKGDQWVIRAMQAHSSAYYLVVGDGPFASELKQLATSLHLEKRVLFLGFQLDVKSFLAASDIAFLLSYGEASSISLLEYAAMELPIVTSRHEPFPELLQDAWGHMVDEQNTSAVSDLITDLSDSERRGRMGKSAREWVIREHNWDDIAGKYRALIQ